MAPIPIALCGKSSSMGNSFAQSMLPEYEVVHHFTSTQAVHRELPLVMSGKSFEPETYLGKDTSQAPSTQTKDTSKVPRAIMVGAGFSEAELDNMRKAEGANNVPWLYPDPFKSAASMMSGPFIMKVLERRVKGCLRANGVVEGKEHESKSGVWSF